MRKTGLYVIALILILSWMPVGAQSDNLLVNPGFEEPFISHDGPADPQVAEGWLPWHEPAQPGQPTFQNIQPDYLPAAPDQTRIRSGANAQEMSAFFGTFTAGVYQRVTGVTPGATVAFQVYAYAWSTTFDEPEVSEEDGDLLISVGIDPTGGADWNSASVVWSQPVEQYDAYNPYDIQTTAIGNAVTVFVRATVGVPVKHNRVYLDDASLSVSGGEQPPVATATSTNTSIPAATDTTAPDTATPTATETVAVESPTATPTTEAAPPTDTVEAPLPVATATFTATMPPPTTTPTMVPTNTATATSLPPSATLAPSPTPPSIPDEFPNTIIHTVRRGETVSILAERYGSTIEAIAEANGLGPNYLIFVGQGLVIPVRLPAPATSTPTNTPSVIVVTATPGGVVPPITGTTTYTVLPGDTLTRIARLYNTTVETLAQLNGIVNVNQIQVGQRLLVPTSETTPPQPPSTQVYIVQPGDNLYRISLRFGVSIQRLAEANNIRQVDRIYVGQRLIIP